MDLNVDVCVAGPQILGFICFTREQHCGSMHNFGSTKQPEVTLNEPFGLKYPETWQT